MKSKGSRLQVTYQDFTDVVQEMTLARTVNCGDARGAWPSFWEKLLSGRVEHRYLRPGLKMALADFYLYQDLEMSGEFSQTELAFVLTAEGFWNGLVKDHRGRTSELRVTPGLNVGTVGPPQRYTLRIRGGQSHRAVRVEITDPFLSELLAGCEMEAAHLRRRMLTPFESRRVLIHRNLSPALEYMVHQVINCPLRARIRQLFLEGKVLEILAHELEAISDADRVRPTLRDPRDLDRLHEARSILEHEFANPPSLFALAHRVGLNDFKLKRMFKETFGTTVFGYVRSLRMERARYLLEIGDLNVTEAALEAGYSSLGHFAFAFKKRFGTLPSQCRAGRQISSVPRR